MSNPARGEVWLADLSPTQGHEQAGMRPCLIVSVDQLNFGKSELVVVVPMTTKLKPIPFHVNVLPPEGGTNSESQIMCEMVRSISTNRLRSRMGELDDSTLMRVEGILKMLLGL